VSLARKQGRGNGRERELHARRTYLRAAIIAAVLIAACVYFAFAKQLPFEGHFVLRGDFTSSNQLEPGNPVRIAGLQIGEVSAISRGPHNTSIVTMSIDEPQELRSNATLAIEPRLLFEGNFYIAVDPGTPPAPVMRSGETVPLANTTTPVQIDQLLDVLDTPTRSSLKQLVSGIASGLGTSTASAANRATSNRATSSTPGSADLRAGAPGSAELRAAAQQLTAALPNVSRVAAALQGTKPGDLFKLVQSGGSFASQLAENPAALADLVTSSDRVFGALAANDASLAQDFVGLDRFVHVAPATLTALQSALPTLTSFARKLQPSLLAAPSTLTDTSSLFDQIDALFAPSQLPAAVSALAPTARSLPALENELRTVFNLATPLSNCVRRNIVPALDTELQDGADTSGYPAWKDLLHLAASLSGASASFDGNGIGLRIGVAEGAQTLAEILPGFGQVLTTDQPLGLRPRWLGYGNVPAFDPAATCDKQPLADINMPNGGAIEDTHFVQRPKHRAGLPLSALKAAFSSSAAADRLVNWLQPITRGRR